jgi:FMN phosphatase YigB (HAD superfamily)
VFRDACAGLGVEPAATLMVGDNPLTDGGAAAAGLVVLLLPAPRATGRRGLRHVLSLVDAAVT